MLIAAVHLHPSISIVAAAVVLVGCVWYWLRMGQAEVPESRRRIRRASIIAILAMLASLVFGLSFVDPQLNQPGYLQTWLFVLIMLAVVILFAVLDILNNLRLHIHEVNKQAVESAKEYLRSSHSQPQQHLTAENSESDKQGRK